MTLLDACRQNGCGPRISCHVPGEFLSKREMPDSRALHQRAPDDSGQAVADEVVPQPV